MIQQPEAKHINIMNLFMQAYYNNTQGENNSKLTDHVKLNTSNSHSPSEFVEFNCSSLQACPFPFSTS